MKNKWIVGGLLLLVGMFAIGWNVKQSHAQEEADRDSLKDQRKAGGGRGPFDGNGPAEANGSGGPMAGMAKELNLSPQQVRALEQAGAEMQQKMASVRFSKNNSQSAMKQLGEMMQPQQSKMDSILNPEQRAKMQSIMKERGFPGGPPGGIGMMGGPPPGMEDPFKVGK